MKRLALLLVLFAARVAAADDGTWQGYETLGIPDEQASVLTGITVEGLREGGLVDSIDTDDVVKSCGPDVMCHCTAARKRGVRYAIFGSLGKLADLWTVELTLVDTHACTIEGGAYLSEAIPDTKLPVRLIQLGKRMTTPPAELPQTAVGAERTLSATPALVTTFSRSQLRALQIRSLDDLLPFVPGFEVVDANWGGRVLNQGLSDTLLILSDGIPLVNGLIKFRWLGRDYRTSLAHVSRVEIVRGPSSVLWGRNALLGVMNIISDVPTRREPTAEAGISIGSLDTEEVWGRFGQNRKQYSFSGSIDVGRRVGPTTEVTDSPQAVVGVPSYVYGNSGTTDPSPDLWFDAHLRLSIANRVDILFQNQTSDTEFEISPRGPLLDPGHGGWWKTTHRLYGLIGTQPIYDQDEWKVTLRGVASRYEFYSWENFAVQPMWPDGPAPDPDDPNARDLRIGLRSIQGNHRPRVANQGDARVLVDFDGAMPSHFTAGVNVLDLRTPDSLATFVGIDQEVTKDKVSFGAKEALTLSAFALEELVPSKGWGLSAGARAQADGIPDKEDNRRWSSQVTAQGGIVFERGPVGAKLVFAQGYRAPDAVSLYSTVFTKGNPNLQPERSNELTTEVNVAVSPGLTLRTGGNLTRVSQLITLKPLPQPDPDDFVYEPHNKGTIDVASGFAQAELHATDALDVYATYHYTALDESNPTIPTGVTDMRNIGIPVAHHTGSFAAVWRPLTDLSVMARGSFASPRHLYVTTADDPATDFVTRWTIRTVVGASLANALGPLALDLSIENPLFLPRDIPYDVSGVAAPLVETRRYTEVFASLRYER